jgi:hypothetical protein
MRWHGAVTSVSVALPVVEAPAEINQLQAMRSPAIAAARRPLAIGEAARVGIGLVLIPPDRRQPP